MMVLLPSLRVVQVQVSQTSQDDKAAAISTKNSVFMGVGFRIVQAELVLIFCLVSQILPCYTGSNWSGRTPAAIGTASPG